MTRALITGISGFTGSHLAKALWKVGYEVHGFVRPSSRISHLADIPIIAHQGDIRDASAVDKAVSGMEIVFHIAAAYRESGLPSAEYARVNVQGTRNAAQAALRHKVRRFVHCSTAGVHGHVEHPPANEEAPFNPGDLYQATKLEGERAVREIMREGLRAVIFRPVGIFGPGDTRFLKLFRSVKHRTFVMFGSGRVLYHLTYVDDLIGGIIACAEHPNAVGNTYIIAGDRATTLNELIGILARVLGVRKPRLRLPFWTLWIASTLCEGLCKPFGIDPPLYRRRAEFFRKDRCFDSSKIQRELGVAPQVSLEEGLERTAAWYREQGLI